MESMHELVGRVWRYWKIAAIASEEVRRSDAINQYIYILQEVPIFPYRRFLFPTRVLISESIDNGQS